MSNGDLTNWIGLGDAVDPKNLSLPPCITVLNLAALGQTVRTYDSKITASEL